MGLRMVSFESSVQINCDPICLDRGPAWWRAGLSRLLFVGFTEGRGWLLFNRAIDVPGFRDVLAWRKSNRAVNGAVKSISVRPKLNPQRSFAPAGGDAVRSGFIADG